MSRAVPTWEASHDDQAIPPRVKLRIFDAAGGRCAHCTLQIVGKLLPAYDHVVALINGGRHAESNLQLLCVPCHAVKTGADVGEKAVVARVRKKHIGIRKPSRFLAARNSIWKKKMDGSVVRR